MDEEARQSRRDAWSAYWAAGALHSCASSYQGGNYAGAIRGFWESHFKGLRTGDRVLDLATGNGALPLLVAEFVGDKTDIRINAIDLADISPAACSDSPLETIFQSGVSMEKLPFPDETFDLVVSQYGLEYARWPEALIESMRVCKQQGSAAFVMHHADSVLVQVARSELEGHRLILEHGGLLDSARDVIPWIGLARAGIDLKDDGGAIGCRERYNQAMNRVSGEIDRTAIPDLLLETRAFVHSLLEGTGAADAAPQLMRLESQRQALQAAQLRMLELVDSAMDIKQASALVEVLHAARPTHDISCEPLIQREGIMGWGVVVQPRAVQTTLQDSAGG